MYIFGNEFKNIILLGLIVDLKTVNKAAVKKIFVMKPSPNSWSDYIGCE